MVTIRDVAKESGVSVTTVSVILNRAPQARHIPAATKNRVKEVVKRLGYHRNLLAGSLRSKRSRTFGVLVFDITDPYCTQILKGVENSLYRHGYVPILADAQNDQRRFNHAVETLLERRVDGLIAVAVANLLFLGADPLKAFAERGIPTVTVGRQLAPPASSVATDNEAGARCALEHLYTLGHREIAFIKGPKALVDTEQRWSGICMFATGVGLELDPELIVQIKGRNSSYAEGDELTHELLTRRRHFTALMAFDDITAFGAISALSSAGVRVPQDCSVLGFDDIPAAAFYNPPLTTVKQGLVLQGSLSVEILVGLVRSAAKNKVDSIHRTVPPKLVPRKTTAPPGHL
jgi:LacI family transcriptional regulator